MTGRGAWFVNFELIPRPRMGALPNAPTEAQLELNYAIQSVQRELTTQGFTAHGHGGDGVFGKALQSDVKDFQKAKALVADGIVGPKTGRALFSEAAARLGDDLPDGILCGLIFAESNFDPYAEGFKNPRDKGLVQLNLDAHPDISAEQAFDSTFALNYCAASTRERHDGYVADYGTDDDVAWDAAAAAWHLPTSGKTWAITGQAPDTKIQGYVDRVRGACVG